MISILIRVLTIFSLSLLVLSLSKILSKEEKKKLVDLKKAWESKHLGISVVAAAAAAATDSSVLPIWLVFFCRECIHYIASSIALQAGGDSQKTSSGRHSYTRS